MAESTHEEKEVGPLEGIVRNRMTYGNDTVVQSAQYR